MVGGASGAYTGGAEGSLVGGFASSSVNTALNGGDFGQSFVSGLIGSGIAYSSYQLTSYANYKKLPQSKWMSFKQFQTISAAAQRSFARGKEFGGWLLDEGGVELWKPGSRAGITPTTKPTNAMLAFHTHPNQGNGPGGAFWNPDFSPPDIRWSRATNSSHMVISRQSIYSMMRPTFTSVRNGSNGLLNPYGYNMWWWNN